MVKKQGEKRSLGSNALGKGVEEKWIKKYCGHFLRRKRNKKQTRGRSTSGNSKGVKKAGGSRKGEGQIEMARP